MSILEITIKKQLSTWKGTRVLVPGHQNSGAPTIFLVFSWLCILNFCWQYSDITKKCQGHINTLEKKDKLIFLMSILEITIKNQLSTWKGTRTLVPLQFFWCFLDCLFSFMLAGAGVDRGKTIARTHAPAPLIDQISNKESSSAESEEDGDKRSFSSDLFDESEMSSLLKPKSKRRVP